MIAMAQNRNDHSPSVSPDHHFSHDRPVAIDLFAGAGGLSLGLEQAGFDVVAAVDHDPIHCAVHAYNFPMSNEICAEIAKVTVAAAQESIRAGLRSFGRHQEWDGEVDLVAGGPPCQGFSAIGRHYAKDERNDLVFEFHRLVTGLRARYFLMENVPGMLAGGHKTAILKALIMRFQRSGYRIVDPQRILNAASFGVPQDRRRLFILGARSDMPLPEYPHPIVAPRAINPARERKRGSAMGLMPLGPSVADAIGDLPDADEFETLLESDSVRLAPEVASMRRDKASPYAARLAGLSTDDTDLSYPRVWDDLLLTSSRRTVHQQASIERFRVAEPGRKEEATRLYRLAADGVSNTIRAGTAQDHGSFTSARPIHPTLARVLTVREAARLHSYPDWFRFHGTKWHGFRQVGNSVPPLLAQAVAAQIVAALGLRPGRPGTVIELGSADLLWMGNDAAARHFDQLRHAFRSERSLETDAGETAAAS